MLSSIEKIERKQIPVYLFTNAPRHMNFMGLLETLGIQSDLYTDVFSSGMHVAEFLETHYRVRIFYIWAAAVTIFGPVTISN